MDCGFALATMRRELEHDGLCLSARGQAGNGDVILPPEENAVIMPGYQKTAIDCLQCGVILARTRIWPR